MTQNTFVAALVAGFSCVVAPVVMAAPISGSYLESRTCQVYTGPCFANAEMGQTGQDAVMAWSIAEGRQDGVDLAGLNVIVAVTGSDTLGFRGLDAPRTLKSVILFDERADSAQREALIAFAKQHAGRAGKTVVRVDASPIQMSLDTGELRGNLTAGDRVKLVTRKARQGDCICMNEVAFYAPLAKVENFAAGVAVEGKFAGRGLGVNWSIPNSRGVYMATFAY